MQEDQIRKTLDAHWQASAAGDLNAEHDIYDDDAICDYPQSGEQSGARDFGFASHHPGKPPASISGEWLDVAIYGSRSTPSTTKGSWLTR